MSVYSDPEVRSDFEIVYKRTGKKLDMGGCCVHFKTLDDLPLDVVGNTTTRGRSQLLHNRTACFACHRLILRMASEVLK
jgi:hypothetical protein